MSDVACDSCVLYVDVDVCVVAALAEHVTSMSAALQVARRMCV